MDQILGTPILKDPKPRRYFQLSFASSFTLKSLKAVMLNIIKYDGIIELFEHVSLIHDHKR